MADRACRNFQPNIFNKNKCQNCYKLQDAHRSSQSTVDLTAKSAVTVESSSGPPTKPTSAHTKAAASKNIVKCGLLSAMVANSRDHARSHENKWSRRWVVLNSTGVVDLFVYDELKGCASQVLVRSVNLDDCTNMFLADIDTGQPYSYGLNTPEATVYFMANEKMEIDSWVRVFKPFVQAASAYPFRRGSRNSVGSLDALERAGSSGSTSLNRGHSFGKSSTVRRPSTPPRSSSIRARYGSVDAIDAQLHMAEPSKGLEKLKEESKVQKETIGASVKHREAVHILEQELKTKTNRLKEVETEQLKCKDYQKAVIFQEQELQDARFTIKDLRQQLEEAEKKSRQQKSKLGIHAKELAEAKADLDEANSIISIHKANIESLKSELTTIKHGVGERSGKVIVSDDEPESDRVFSFNGDTGDKKDIEAKLKVLVQKLRQNERELMIKTRELEKANESRSKVAKYTRSLLQELETKLSNNERKLAETENQLNNSTIELEYEQEHRAKIEKENEKLRDDLEKLQDLNRKTRLSQDALALMEEATKDKNPALNELKEKLCASEKKLQDIEKENAFNEKEFTNEIALLKSKLKSSESLANKNETKYKECKEELQKAREKSIEVRRVSQELEAEHNSRLQLVVTARDKELKSAKDSIEKLENEIAALNKKNEELEAQFDSMDEKLCQSLEKQFSLTEQNEKLTEEKEQLISRIKTLQEETADLQLVLSKIDESKSDLEKEKISELEKALNDKVKDVQNLQAVLNEKEEKLKNVKFQLETSLKTTEKLKEERNKANELEKRIEDLLRALEEKDNDLQALRNDNENLKQEFALLEASNDDTAIDSNRVEELEQQLSQYELFLSTAKDTITGYEQQIKDLTSNDKNADFESSNKEMKKNISALESELEVYKEKLSAAEERLLDYEVEEKLLTSELLKLKKEASLRDTEITVTQVDGVESDPNQMDEDEKDYQKLIDAKTDELIKSENKVVELAEELDKRLQLEQETTQWIEDVEENLSKTEDQLVTARRMLLAKSQELEREKGNILDLVELSRKYIKELEGSLATEKSKVEVLEKNLKEQQCKATLSKDLPDGQWYPESTIKEITDKLTCCENERDGYKTKMDDLTKELEETKHQVKERLDSAEKAHQKDMKKLNEETLKVSGVAKTEGDELRLRLTSRVITLQSDISELKAAHQTVIEKLKARHKKELESARREAILEYTMKQSFNESAEDVNASMVEMENEMKKMVSRYEAQMELLKQNHQREMDRLKRGSDHGEGLKTEVTQLQAEMEEMSQKYMEQIETMKDKHAEELDQLKTDMSLVIQASLASNNSSPTKEHAESSQQLKARIKELEDEMEEVSQKYNEELRVERESQQKELDQIRDDMMTVIQAVKSQKYDLDPDTEQLQRTVREQEEEIKRLKESGSSHGGGSDSAEVEKLKDKVKELSEEKEEVEKCLKRQEAATMFGLRRTEEMSNKIYQMQKEMEDIDRKYMKEINVYKEAYEREKELKASSGSGDLDLEELRAENEELRIENEELRLKMEEDEALHENELCIYKDKLGEEKLLDVEHLMMKIKGLEDSIEEIKLEHQRELEELQESHAENVKNLNSEHKKELQNLKKETENSTSTTKGESSRVSEEHKEKVRSLEFKIEELESLLEVKKRRHKEEVRNLKEKLDEEMQRHIEDRRNYETKLRECDITRRPSLSSGPGASEYFRKQLSEVRAENRTLKDELETLRSELAALRTSSKPAGTTLAKAASSNEKPTKDIKHLASESDVQATKTSKDTKEPLRKTSSDTKGTESSKRSFKTPATSTEKHNETSDKTKTFTRQGSKNEVKKSVAERVAMFQTPSKSEKSARIK